MSDFYVIEDNDCHHPQWCRAKAVGEHAPECPTQLALSEGDVDAFCAQYVTLECTDATPGRFEVAVHVDGSVSRVRLAEIPSTVKKLSGEFDGRFASTTSDLPWARRWIAEHLIKHKLLVTSA